MLTRQQLEDLRHQGDRVYGYKKAFCDGNSCCERCDKLVRLGCKIMCKIESLQTKRILKICANSGHQEADNDINVVNKECV